MKKIFLILALSGIILHASSQCLGSPHPFAVEDVSKICTVLGIAYINVYTNTCIENAKANVSAGRVWVEYNPYFFEKIYIQLGRASNISVLSHEIGHTISNQQGYYSTHQQRSYQNELNADFYSGVVMRRLGFSLEEALITIKYIQSPQGNSTHPPLQMRLDAIERGWYKG